MIPNLLFLILALQTQATPVPSTKPVLENSQNMTEEGGCDFDDNLLVDGSSNDYSAFKNHDVFKWTDQNNRIPYFFHSSVEPSDQQQIEHPCQP